MKLKFLRLLLVLIVSTIVFCGCKDDEVITDLGGGSFMVVNHNANDTIIVKAGIHVGTLDELKVYDGELIEIKYIPDKDYEEYNFAVTYTLMDGTKHTSSNKDYSYQFTVSDWGAKKGTISFSAKSTDDNININAFGNINVTLIEDKTSVKLNYNFTCDGDLLDFVTPELIYTDRRGEHSIMLDETNLSSTTWALCSYTENGITHEDVFELKDGEEVPEPWQVDEYITRYNKELDVKLNKIGITNNVVVKYHKKSQYTIEAGKEYRLSRSLFCRSGFCSFTSSDGNINMKSYIGVSIDMGGKRIWTSGEVESYINEICAKNDIVTMKIDGNGNISPLKE